MYELKKQSNKLQIWAINKVSVKYWGQQDTKASMSNFLSKIRNRDDFLIKDYPDGTNSNPLGEDNLKKHFLNTKTYLFVGWFNLVLRLVFAINPFVAPK